MNKKCLRVFEAFAGIGAQASALSRMNIKYEIVGISDWYVDAIECYAAMHCGNKTVQMLNLNLCQKTKDAFCTELINRQIITDL